MKKIIIILLSIFMACTLFAKQPQWNYVEILEVLDDESEPDLQADFDNNVSLFAEYVWKTYFPEQYAKYGIPFYCLCYEMESSIATSHRMVYDENGKYKGSLIILHNNYLIEEIDKGMLCYGVADFAYDFCNIVACLEMSKEQLDAHPSPLNSVFLREVERLQDDYDLDVHLYDRLSLFFPNR